MTYVYELRDGAMERVGYIDPKTGHVIKFSSKEED